MSCFASLLTIKAPGTGQQELRNKLQSLEAKLANDQLHLAVLGQMKRGKSSFINALSGLRYSHRGSARNGYHHGDPIRS